VFTDSLLRNKSHIPFVLSLLAAGHIENTASSIVACWVAFTELLPGNVLIKSVTVLTTVLQLISFFLKKERQ
jgi:hypothetical protein